MEDSISRQAAIDTVQTMYKRCDTGDITDYRDMMCEAFMVLPSVQEQRWIPVTERLPENGRQVLVYARSVHYALAKYDEMRVADGVYRKQWVTFDAWKPFYTIREVIAWRELPDPYKGEE